MTGSNLELKQIDGLAVKFRGTVKGVRSTWVNNFTLDESGQAISKMLVSGEADKVVSIKPIIIWRYIETGLLVELLNEA